MESLPKRSLYGDILKSQALGRTEHYTRFNKDKILMEKYKRTTELYRRKENYPGLSCPKLMWMPMKKETMSPISLKYSTKTTTDATSAL